MGAKAAMACTAAVEEVIDEHYASQIARLGDKDPELAETVETFRVEEVAHRDTAFAHGAEQAPGYRLLSEGIKALRLPHGNVVCPKNAEERRALLRQRRSAARHAARCASICGSVRGGRSRRPRVRLDGQIAPGIARRARWRVLRLGPAAASSRQGESWMTADGSGRGGLGAAGYAQTARRGFDRRSAHAAGHFALDRASVRG